MKRSRLTRKDVVDAAFRVLAEVGLEQLTLRAISRELDVYLNSVSWQVKSKAQLLAWMADDILSQVDIESLPEDSTDRVFEIMKRYRAALLAYRDGARLVAGTTSLGVGTLALGEQLVAALLQISGEPRDASHAFWSLAYFTLGLTEEEQASATDIDAAREALTELEHYPALTEAAAFLADQDFETRFSFGIRAILAAVSSRVTSTP